MMMAVVFTTGVVYECSPPLGRHAWWGRIGGHWFCAEGDFAISKRALRDELRFLMEPFN